MGNYNFTEDLACAQRTEDEVAERLLRIPDSRILDKNNDRLYDLAMVIYDLPRYIEVKDDLESEKTGNIAVEFKCRGKWSGIYTTHADCWAYKYRHLNDPQPHFRLVGAAELQRAHRSKRYRTVIGGDKGSGTHMFLIPTDEFEIFGVAF